MNFVAFASIVLEKDGKYLLVQEGKPENYGLWNLPGGHVEIGEHLLDAVKREAKEETSTEVEVESFLRMFADVRKKHSFHFVFKGKILNGTPMPGDTIIACKWVTLKEITEIPKDQLLNAWKFEKIIEQLKEEKSYPLSILSEREW